MLLMKISVRIKWVANRKHWSTQIFLFPYCSLGTRNYIYYRFPFTKERNQRFYLFWFSSISILLCFFIYSLYFPTAAGQAHHLTYQNMDLRTEASENLVDSRVNMGSNHILYVGRHGSPWIAAERILEEEKVDEQLTPKTPNLWLNKDKAESKIKLPNLNGGNLMI